MRARRPRPTGAVNGIVGADDVPCPEREVNEAEACEAEATREGHGADDASIGVSLWILARLADIFVIDGCEDGEDEGETARLPRLTPRDFGVRLLGSV